MAPVVLLSRMVPPLYRGGEAPAMRDCGALRGQRRGGRRRRSAGPRIAPRPRAPPVSEAMPAPAAAGFDQAADPARPARNRPAPGATRTAGLPAGVRRWN